MRTPFVPPDFTVPEIAIFSDLYAVPLTAKDANEDLAVLLANADMITQQRGGDGSKNKWPYAFTLEENYIDLAWLETCAKLRQLFSYVLRDKRDKTYAGCVYIYPIELYYPELAGKYDVDFSFWITKKVYGKGVYGDVFTELLDWLVTGWKFPKKRIYLRNREIPSSFRQG